MVIGYMCRTSSKPLALFTTTITIPQHSGWIAEAITFLLAHMAHVTFELKRIGVSIEHEVYSTRVGGTC